MAAGYRKLELVRPIIERALERASALPVFENSHREEAANLVGCIGEIAFETLLDRHDVRYEDATTSTRHDYIVGGRYRVDVKTKDRTVFPRADFDNSVPLYNHEHQRPDFYYFVSLFRDPNGVLDDPFRFKVACLVGGISLGRLEEIATRWDSGQVDPRNGTRFWTACLNVSMNDLVPNEEFLRQLR